MSHKRVMEALTWNMKDIKRNQSILLEMMLLLADYFKQTLTVITRGTPTDEINACLKMSTLWKHLKIFSLTTNMQYTVIHNQDNYTAALLEIG